MLSRQQTPLRQAGQVAAGDHEGCCYRAPAWHHEGRARDGHVLDADASSTMGPVPTYAGACSLATLDDPVCNNRARRIKCEGDTRLPKTTSFNRI